MFYVNAWTSNVFLLIRLTFVMMIMKTNTYVWNINNVIVTCTLTSLRLLRISNNEMTCTCIKKHFANKRVLNELLTNLLLQNTH